MSTQQEKAAQLPITVQQQLIDISERLLPPRSRDEFIANTVNRISHLAHTYDNTLVYTAVGWVIGQILEQMPVVGWVVSDSTSELGALIGALMGFRRDRKEIKKRREVEERVSTIVAEELETALKERDAR